ncbi:MAG TPA: TIGR03560 family F420-dependent LLM class oxidoreductase [Acidimicrobiia bacterium]|nr:TIGR03560 family F420-dependent LLM class oxidoreductase [Acidimicrobiia bacterium]
MELRLPAPSLVVLVGPSGSGKSTWAALHFAPYEIVSSDGLRAMVGAGPDDQTAGTTAFHLLEIIVTERMRRGLTTVIDTLGLNVENRTRWVALAHESGIPAHAIVFDTDPEVCEQRNEARERPIPKTALRRQISQFNEIREHLADEDFDGVHTEQPVAVVATTMATSTAPDEEGDGEPTATPRHTFGLLVSRFDWESGLGPTLTSIARRAEDAGFRDIWLMDHFRQIRGVGRPWEDIPEAYVSLGFIAGVTTTIRVGSLVTGVTHRHPVLLGKMIASLDVISGGRVMCGLGVAWDEAEHDAYGIEFPEVGDRYGILEETLQMLPLLWGKGSPEFHGRHIDANELICYPRPVQERIPLMVGGSGEKRTLRLVARYADACNVFGDPDRVRHKVEVLHRHCDELDRDPATIEVTHLTNSLVAEDRTALRARVERLRDRNTPAEQYMKRHNAGTADDLEVLFAGYSDAGADHSIVSLPDVAMAGSIEAFADVISRFASP